jgi:hypothetical protein
MPKIHTLAIKLPRGAADFIVDLNSEDSLTEGISILEEHLASVKTGIEEAKAKAISTGEYSDPMWFHRARTAQRFKGMQHQRLLKRLAELRRVNRAVKQSSFEARFIQAARRLLNPETFQKLCEEAKGE